jgi:hypothetical protein
MFSRGQRRRVMEVFCLGSGPSLTPEDVELVRQWRTGDRKVYVVNNTWQLAPWADVLFAGDAIWIELEGPKVQFAGKKFTQRKNSGNGWDHPGSDFHWINNSGASLVSLAIHHGATKVYLLGFDCKRLKGRAHWHEAHAGKSKNGRKMKDAPNIEEWPHRFADLASYAKQRGVVVENCSRRSVLECFPKATLESVLEPTSVPARQNH